MASKLAGFLIGLGLVAAVGAPSYACSFNTQASADTQQQTAQAQPQQPVQTSTQ